MKIGQRQNRCPIQSPKLVFLLQTEKYFVLFGPDIPGPRNCNDNLRLIDFRRNTANRPHQSVVPAPIADR